MAMIIAFYYHHTIKMLKFRRNRVLKLCNDFCVAWILTVWRFASNYKWSYFVMNDPEKKIRDHDHIFIFQFEPPHRQYLRRQNSWQSLGTRLRSYSKLYIFSLNFFVRNGWLTRLDEFAWKNSFIYNSYT